VDFAAWVTAGGRTAFGDSPTGTEPAYSLAQRICVDPGLAENVAQEAFLALWRNPAACNRSRRGFGTWVVHHRAVDAVRREKTQGRRSVPLADEVSERNVTPAEWCRGAKALQGPVP
jgi:DNA-directed RNA polymerase specialized sigma24 family protein